MKDIIAKFEEIITVYEDEMFGIYVFNKGTKVLYGNSPQIVAMQEQSFNNVYSRMQSSVIKAKLILENAKAINDTCEIQAFVFPPVSGHPMLDEMHKRVIAILAAYNKLYPGRDRDNNLNDSELLKLMEVSANELF